MEENNMEKNSKNKKYMCEDSFLTNPVASATDCTGYVVTNPGDEERAESYASLYDVPVSATDGSNAVPPAR